MRMLTGFEIWHGRICLFNTVLPGGNTKRHANYINFQKCNVFDCIHLLITEFGSICYEPGSNHLLQLLAPLRSIGDKKNKTTDKTTYCQMCLKWSIPYMTCSPNNSETWIIPASIVESQLKDKLKRQGFAQRVEKIDRKKMTHEFQYLV